MIRPRPALTLWLVVVAACRGQGLGPATPAATSSSAGASPRVVVALEPGLAEGPLDGRLLILVAPVTPRADPEPRFQLTDGDDTAQVFGVDVDGWDGRTPRRVEGDVAGYPLASLAALPPGEYTVQALFNRYETYRRADGHVLKLPPDRGEGQQWNLKPGNLLSTPCKLRIAPGETAAVTLDQVIPPLPPPRDSALIRNVSLRSERLSAFWGRDVELGAIVLLPAGWDTHPTARYPLLVYHSHFGSTLTGWRETPPDAALPAVDLDGLRRECPDGHGAACARHGYERYMQEASHRFYQQWIGPRFPRVILVQINHANAITHELLPHIERRFRASAPAGRAACTAARRAAGRRWRRRSSIPTNTTARSPTAPTRWTSVRTWPSTSTHTTTPTCRAARSARPRAPPRATRTARHAAPWRWTTPSSSRSARARARGSSSTSGRRCTRRSARTATRSASSTSAPAPSTRPSHPMPDAVFRYGARDGHCWSGDAAHLNFESRMTYHARFIPMLVDHFLRTAPRGAGVKSWRY